MLKDASVSSILSCLKRALLSVRAILSERLKIAASLILLRSLSCFVVQISLSADDYLLSTI
jgi:hypothetical protein